MFKKIIFYSVLGAGIILGLQLSLTTANALNPFDISYPVVELGSCNSQKECKAFCDNPDNQDACFDWAAKQGIVSEREVKRRENRKRFEQRSEDPYYDGGAPIEDFGPGGCKSFQECDKFCRIEENLDECMQYSVDHGYIEQEEADKIRAQVDQGGPGGCKSSLECDKFCRNPENMQTCMQFVVDEGRITQEEADFMIMQAEKHGGPGGPGDPGGHRGQDDDFDEEKAKQLLEEIGGPGGCNGMDECEVFCGNPDNDEICMAFALEHGLIDPEKAEKMQKIMKAGGPGGCRGPQECDAFCRQPGNGEICMNFAIENEMMPQEEIEMMKREMEIVKRLDERAGPGGCSDPRECQSFCNNTENMDECMNFATENGMMDEGQADMVQEKMRRMEGMIEGRERFEERLDMFMGPPSGEGFGSRDGFRDFEDHRMSSEEMDRKGGEFDSNRRDLEQFDDFEKFKKEFKREYKKEFKNDFEGDFDKVREAFEEEMELQDKFPGERPGESFHPRRNGSSFIPTMRFNDHEERGEDLRPSDERFEHDDFNSSRRDFKQFGDFKDDEGYEDGNLDSNRQDFQKFGDYEGYKRRFEEGRFDGLEDFTSPEGEVPPDGMRAENPYRGFEKGELDQYKEFMPLEGEFAPMPRSGFTSPPEGARPPLEGEEFNYMQMMQSSQDGFGPADSLQPMDGGFMPYHDDNYISPTTGGSTPPDSSYMLPEGEMKELPLVDGPVSLIAPQSLLGSVLVPVLNIFR